MVDLTRIYPNGFKVPAPAPRTDPFADFEAELVHQGYDVPGPVRETDDKPVRMKRDGSKDKPGWYHFNLFRKADGSEIGFGHFGDWRENSTVSWSSKAGNLNDVDRAHFEQQRRSQAEMAKVRRNELHNDTAKSAREFLATCQPVISHPYLTAKGIKAHGVLERSGQLIIPMKNADGEIRSYQRISSQGDKLYLADAQKSGCFHLIGQVGIVAYITEGFATGASVHEATGQGVFVAFDTSGLGPTVKAARKLFPNVRLIIAGDNDSLKTDAGRIAADKAASQDTNTSVIIPKVPGDWNDLAQSQGLEAVKAALEPLGEVKKRLLIHASQLVSTPPEWIIDHVLPQESLTVMFGESGCGKSFIALDMGLAIARGADWQGHEIGRQGAVVYICGEGKSGIRRRLDANAIQNNFRLEDVPFYVSRTSIQMLDQVAVAEFVAEALDLIRSIGLVALIIIDTYARNFGDGDENSNKDASRWVEAADLIRVELSASVAVCHHTGLGDQGRMRGASALKAAIDTEIKVASDEDGFCTIQGLKMKDGEDVRQHRFELKKIHLGTDSKGKDYGSLVPVLCDAANEDTRLHKIGERQLTVYSHAKKLHQQMLQNLPEGSTPQFTNKDLVRYIDGLGGKKIRSDHFKDTLEGLVKRELLSFEAPHYSING